MGIAQSYPLDTASSWHPSASASVTDFGARGDSLADASTGTDDTAAIQAAIDHIGAKGGGTLFVPEGYYKITSYLKLCANLNIIGAGRNAAWIVAAMAGGGGATEGENVRNGTAFYSGWPSNASNASHITIENIGLASANSDNVGAGFYDNCGGSICLTNCQIDGFKYGIVLDQTELCDIARCEFRLQNPGGAGVYLVNGPTLTPANLTTVTNRISVTRCQINEYQETYGILDEGGYTHSFIDNNYNGCLNHIYAAGVQALQVIGGEFEACAAASIEMEYRRVADLSGVGASCGIIIGMMNAPGAHPCIHIQSLSGPLSVIGNCLLRSDGSPPIIGASNAYALHLVGNTLSPDSNGEIVDGYNGGNLFDSRIEMAVTDNSGLASLNLNHVYAKKFVRCIRATPQTLTIQADSSALVPIGATYTLEQSTAAGTVTLAVAAGVSLAGPTATNGQYQRLVARKIAANNWVSQLVVANPLDSNPAASATPTVNGQMLFELTSNTTLKAKVRGSDGVVRSTTLTLA